MEDAASTETAAEITERGPEVPLCTFLVLNATSPLGSALPHLLGMLSCLSVGKKTKMMRGGSSVVNALAQLLILLSEIHNRQVLVLGKLLFPRPRARKLFKCFYDKWWGKLCGQQGVWLTLSSRSSLPFSWGHKYFKSQEIPPAWQLMRDAGVRISQAAAEMPLNRSWACPTTLTFYDRLVEITSLCSPHKWEVCLHRQWCSWASKGKILVDFHLSSSWFHLGRQAYSLMHVPTLSETSAMHTPALNLLFGFVSFPREFISDFLFAWGFWGMWLRLSSMEHTQAVAPCGNGWAVRITPDSWRAVLRGQESEGTVDICQPL